MRAGRSKTFNRRQLTIGLDAPTGSKITALVLDWVVQASFRSGLEVRPRIRALESFQGSGRELEHDFAGSCPPADHARIDDPYRGLHVRIFWHHDSRQDVQRAEGAAIEFPARDDRKAG